MVVLQTWRNRRVEASQCFIAFSVDNTVDYLILIYMRKNSNRKETRNIMWGVKAAGE
jgi:hypothetical protein